VSDDECECEEMELALNPERQCSRCRRFIPFGGPAHGAIDCSAWIESMRIPEEKRVRRCIKCWKGAGCVCESPSYLDGGTR
jgi:hypothetical protein